MNLAHIPPGRGGRRGGRRGERRGEKEGGEKREKREFY